MKVRGDHVVGEEEIVRLKGIVGKVLLKIEELWRGVGARHAVQVGDGVG
jgi:hypothetical protein